MSRLGPLRMELAGQLLAHEEAASVIDAAATPAACRVYDKLNTQLVLLLGEAGVQALLLRSIKLAKLSLPGGMTLRECLEARDAAVSTESATVLFGTLLELLSTFIGERLTNQILHRAWPMVEPSPLKEKENE